MKLFFLVLVALFFANGTNCALTDNTILGPPMIADARRTEVYNRVRRSNFFCKTHKECNSFCKIILGHKKGTCHLICFCT
ncbi:jg17663 [Pararge aegeria aegeria]|uniref:Jg17663 protein n=1 Tax=Pararge aegeria aegeria TaxID=348720 RepID=A0A8S4RH96_9NEOP|nr:jg17663 [Pararge aegeria aegeria]